MAQEFPSGDLLCVLTQSLGADTLVVDRAWSPVHRAQLASFRDFLRPQYADDAVLVYALEAPRGGCREG